MILLLLLGLSSAFADEAGQAWLQRIDATAHVEQAHLLLDVTVTDKRGQEAPRTLEIWQSGDSQRLVRLQAPARLAGTALLVSEGDTVHLFLPAYPPARRVVGSKRQDAFLGTDFAVEDLARLTYADDYEAVVVGTQGGLTELALRSKGEEGPVRLRLEVDEQAVVRKALHLDPKGEPSRRLTMDEVALVDGVPLAHVLRVEDLKRGRSTRARLQTADLATPLSSELFTVTNLERP